MRSGKSSTRCCMTRSSSAGSRSWRPRSWATAAVPGFDAGQLRRMLSAVRGSGRDSASRHLLEAMKPYLAEKRRRKIDRAMKLARLASLAELAAGEMGEDDDV